VLANGATLTYFFDSLFPDDYSGGNDGADAALPPVDADVPNLRALLPQVQTLVMKGFIPKPVTLLSDCLPLLNRVFTTEDNHVSFLRGLRGHEGVEGGVEEDVETDIKAEIEADSAADDGSMHTSLASAPPSLDHITFHVYPEFDVGALQEAAAGFEDSWDATQYMMHIF
jgi:hypothetical protein